MVQTAQCNHRRTGSSTLSFRLVGFVLVETTRSCKSDAVEPRVEQSTSCRAKKVGILLVFPEDFGDHVSSRSASPWSARDVRDIECTCGVRRGSAFLCQLAGTDQKRPVGILTNLPQVKSKHFYHWPSLVRCGDELLYNGPLPGSCPCVPQHEPFRGTDAQADFVSSSSQSPGSSFWKLCLADVVDGSPLSLDRWRSVTGSSSPISHSFFQFLEWCSLGSAPLFLLDPLIVVASSSGGCRQLWTGLSFPPDPSHPRYADYDALELCFCVQCYRSGSALFVAAVPFLLELFFGDTLGFLFLA